MWLANQTCTKEMLMRDNLRLYHTMVAQIRKWLPDERITRVRNLALFLTGLYLSRKVHLAADVSASDHIRPSALQR